MTALGGAVIDAVPPGVKDWAVALFGTADKLALLAGMALVIAALAALSGVLELRRRFAGAAVFAVFGIVGAGGGPDPGAGDCHRRRAPGHRRRHRRMLLQSLIRRLASVAGGRAAGPGPAGARFLQLLGGTGAAVLVGGAVATAWRGGAAGVSEVRADLRLPAPRSAGSSDSGRRRDRPGRHGAACHPKSRTSTGSTPHSRPRRGPAGVDAEGHRPGGAGDRARLRGPAGQTADGTARDHRLRLQRGGRRPDRQRAAGSAGRSANCWPWPAPRPVRTWCCPAARTAGPPARRWRSSRTTGTPCWPSGMNGEPLPLEHGFPVRLIVPGLYGYVSATKWLTELKVTRFADDVALLDAARLVRTRAHQDLLPHRCAPRRPVGPCRARWCSAAWPGRSTPESAKWSCASTAAAGSRPSWLPGSRVDTWYQWQLGIDLHAGTARGPGARHRPRRRTAGGGAQPGCARTEPPASTPLELT